MQIKQFKFSKDDFLMGVLNSINDSFVKSAIVQNIIKEKIKRLNSEINLKNKNFETKFGYHDTIKNNWETYSPKFKKDCNAAIDKLNKLLNQKNEMQKIYNELQNNSFSNYEFKDLEKVLERLFKWEKPLRYDDLKNGRY
jgi:hypothetical protein